MKYISVCSGIEAASVAWEPLGWEPLAFAEIGAFPSAVLAHRFPDVPNLGDILKIDWRPYHGTVDLVVGGTPCQSFSFAGRREGLDGASGLVFEYFRLLREVKPRWFVWENVPGAFSSNGGADFQSILREWDKLGYHVAWRVLDAQFFGVPQRRRRIFAVGHLGNWRYPAKVLFEPDCLRGHTKKSGKKRKEAAASAESGVAKCLSTSNQRLDYETETFVTAPVTTTPYADNAAQESRLVCATLNASGAGTSRPAGQGNELDFLVPTPINTQVATRYKALGRGTGFGVGEPGEPGEPAYTLQAGHSHAVAALTADLMPRIAVRRLTPTECERLQGFPDGWTDIPWSGKDHAPDSPRYKALGNSMAVPCMRWIGERIAKIER